MLSAFSPGLLPHPPRCLCILHVLFSHRIAGSERYCIDLANRQAAAGHRVHVVGRRHTPISEELSPLVTFHGWALPVFRGARLRRLATQIGADVCHGHLSAACKALWNMPPAHRTVATLHVGYKAHQHQGLNALICVNPTQSQQLGDYRGLVRTIPNWLPERPRTEATCNLRRELGIGGDEFVIGAVGRLHSSKGMDVLVQAFRAVAPKGATLVIFGDGPQRAALERLRAGDTRIRLLGFRPDARDSLRETDLFVCPSREESFGLALVEAMASGVPIVTTSADGPAEFLRNHPVVFVPPGSVSSLAAAIRDAYECFISGNLARIDYDMTEFDPALRVASITDLYERIMVRARSEVAEKATVPMLAQ